jgi:rhamnosyltransferase
MDTKRIAAVIVCYNPEPSRLKENIRHVYHQVDRLLIIDNNSPDYPDYSQMISGTDFPGIKTELIRNNRNEGIAKSLNIAIGYCIRNNYEWLLTLDQDSTCHNTMIRQLFSGEVVENVAMLAPQIVDINIADNQNNSIKKRRTVTFITSGSVINVAIAQKIGGFDEKMFIDHVDNEFCLRLIVNGFRLVYKPEAKLYQELGRISMHNFLGSKVLTTNHLAFRRYYLYRNGIYIYKKYFRHFPAWVTRGIFSQFKTILLIILYEENKYEKLKCISRGMWDGLTNNFNNAPEAQPANTKHLQEKP